MTCMFRVRKKFIKRLNPMYRLSGKCENLPPEKVRLLTQIAERFVEIKVKEKNLNKRRTDCIQRNIF